MSDRCDVAAYNELAAAKQDAEAWKNIAEHWQATAVAGEETWRTHWNQEATMRRAAEQRAAQAEALLREALADFQWGGNGKARDFAGRVRAALQPEDANARPDDAKLIAAAPALANALEELLPSDSLDTEEEDYTACKNAEAALRAAGRLP